MYERTDAQRTGDFARSRAYEEHVSEVLGVANITRFDSPNDLDIFVPTDIGDGWYLEIKEKNQRYTDRWHLLDGVLERDLFIIDELTTRRALLKYPKVFYLLRDNVGAETPRLFLIPLWELVCMERHRVDRVRKGKWILDLAPITRLASEGDIVEAVATTLIQEPWLQSNCMGGPGVEQV